MSTRTPPSPSLSRIRWQGVVRTGWNRASYRYRPLGETSDCFGHREREYRAWLDPIVRSLPRHAEVLDLGCGTGVPAARLLSRRFRVTGVDLSDVQIRRARRLVAGAKFLRADMCDVDFAPGTFAAVVSLYSLIHVPREQHRALLRKVAK
ncbi:MAG: class I SAM-dependent methyltransferase [Thermoplasmata archaeon]